MLQIIVKTDWHILNLRTETRIKLQSLTYDDYYLSRTDTHNTHFTE